VRRRTASGILKRVVATRVDSQPPAPADADTARTLLHETDRDRPATPRPTADADEDALRPGERIGRYQLLEVIGRGGMGTVYSAFDPALERRVAIKLLRRMHGAPEERERLLTEAKAMAQLSHPNVVTVHEVAVDRGRVFLAMEYVAGRTARSWLVQRQRSWREIVAIYRQAAMGLAAAHAAGIVHRDVKPDNILVGTDDRVRITDFGIAVGVDKANSGRSGDEHPGLDRLGLDHLGFDGGGHSKRLTLTTGTPAYMSPEHLRGDPLDERSDQFGFGVALFEALYGRRPYEGKRAKELRSAHNTATVTAPTDNDVPAWLRRLVLQTLQVDPAKRWPSMQIIARQLDVGARALARPWQRWLLVVVPIGIVGGVIAGGYMSEAATCEQAAAISETWDDPQRNAITTALERAGPAFAGETARAVVRMLDGYTEQWTASYEDACHQHRSGIESDSLFDRRQTCLRARHRAVTSLVDVLEEADRATLRNAIGAVDGLPPIRECEAANLVDDAMWALPVEPERRARHEAVLDALTQVQSLFRAGRFDDGRAQAIDAVAAARALGDDAVMIRALMIRGEYEFKLDHTDDALVTIAAAWHLALRSGNTIDAVRAAIRQIELVGYTKRDEPLALVRVADAKSLIDRVQVHNPEVATELDAALLRAQGLVALRFVRPEAIEHLTLALSTIRSLPARPELEIADYLRALANAEFPLGEHEQALAHYQEALGIIMEILGPDHPDVGGLHNNIGLLLRNMNRAKEGAVHLERALAIAVAAFDRGHSSVIMSESNLASVYHQLGDSVRAVPHWEGVFELPVSLQGADASTIMRLMQFGRDLLVVGRAADALAIVDVVLAGNEIVTPLGQRAGGLKLRAEALRALGRDVEADLAFVLARRATDALGG